MNKRVSKKMGVGILAVVVLLLGGWFLCGRGELETNDARVDGTVVTVSTKVAGKVAEVLVKENEEVKKGQVLVRIDPEDIQAQKAKAIAVRDAAQAQYDAIVSGYRHQEIAQANAELREAEANRDNLYSKSLRMEKLYHGGAVSKDEYDDAVSAHKQAKATYEALYAGADLKRSGNREEDIRVAKAALDKAKAELEIICIAEKDSVIIAPTDGIIAQKNVSAGEIVAVGKLLFSLVDYQDLWLNARIEETQIGKIKLGQTVKYTLDAYPNHTFRGVVYEIGAVTSSKFSLIPAENSSGYFTKVMQRVPIKVTPDKQEDIVFRPGMQGTVKISLD